MTQCESVLEHMCLPLDDIQITRCSDEDGEKGRRRRSGQITRCSDEDGEKGRRRRSG
ncbi:unnamed protein product [Tetraodon nigroviridis]|uniref:(spotted green pufferfish) hypothetical protein n=1 Tax=Tetraodon nigroviridis TaxID=99883 RepID=Q4RIT3_TETNG|nr:unnamed protein product [Tetraodon nigroviridis]